MRRFAFYSLLTILTMVALAMLAVNYVRSNFKVATVDRPNGADVSIQTPGGEFKIRAHSNLDPSTLGIPVYPGARRHKNGGGATFEWTSADGKSDKAMGVAGADYITRDSPEKVRSWFHDHLPNWVVVEHHNGDAADFEFNEGGYKRLVAIREKSDGTHIGVASIGEPASN